MCHHTASTPAATPAPLIVTISGVTYDISSWVEKHPGGTVITAACGIDGTALFLSHHLGASLTRAQAVLAKLPRVEKSQPVPCGGVERVSEHYASLAAEVKAVQQKDGNTAALDWLVGIAGVLLLAFTIVRSRLYGDFVCSLSMLLLSRISDGYLHAAGHGQRFQVPLLFKWFCTAFHYTFGQAPYGHGGLYYYYPWVTRPWRGTHFGHHLVTNTGDDFEHTELYDLPSCAKHEPRYVLYTALTAPTGLRTAAVAFACARLVAPSSHPMFHALPYLAGAWWQWRPHVVKTASILRSIAAGRDTERPDPAAYKLFAWFAHLLVGADGPGLLMWFTCTPLVASLYPLLGSLVFDLFWVPVFGLSQHSLFNAVRSEQDEMKRDAVPWDVQQVLTSADCIATGMCRVYDALCMHADTYQTTHHLFPAVHWSHMPALQPRVARWCKEHNHPYSAVTDVKALMDWFTTYEAEGKVNKRRRAT
jgi:hypothetical protein